MDLKSLFSGRGDLFRNTSILSLGLVAGQALGMLISPLLTRLYTPEDFSALALFLSFTSVLSVVITLRYELGIMLPKADGDAWKLGKLTLLLSLAFSLGFLLISYLLSGTIASWFPEQHTLIWLYLAPLGAFLTAAYQVFNYWNNRSKAYRPIALSKVTDSGTNNFTKALTGYVSPTPFGLISGYIIGKFLGIANLLSVIKKYRRAEPSSTSYKQLAKQYIDLPIKSTPGALLNILAYQAPVLMLGYFFQPELLGFYSLTDKLLYAPTIFLGKAIGQVYFQRASEILGTPALFKLTKKITVSLSLFSLVPIAVLMLWGPELFSIVFGEEWSTAGYIAAALAPMYFIRFIFSCQVYLLTVANRMGMELIFNLVNLAVTVGALLAGKYIYNDPHMAFRIMSIGSSLVFLSLGALIIYYAKIYSNGRPTS